ncbi:MAG: hypothetical protein IKY92_09615 [Akkermansia sp.]|nr:hypothetical protein [Akkermansia sp.]
MPYFAIAECWGLWYSVRDIMRVRRTRRVLMSIALIAAVWGGVSTWFYINDLVQPVLRPVNQSYDGYTSVPRKAPGLRMEPFTFKGWDGGDVQAVIAVKDGEESSRQLSVIGDLMNHPVERLGQIDYVLVCVDWDHGIRSALPVAESLTAAGLTCILWEPRGVDDRRLYCTHGLKECRDVPLLLDAVEARSGKASPVFAAVGQGYGASLLLQAAAVEPRIRGLVSIDAYASLRQSVERTMPESMLRPLMMWLMDQRISRTAGMESFDVAPVEQASSLDRNVPVLVVNLAQDSPVSNFKDAMTIYGRLPSDQRDVWTLRTQQDAAGSAHREVKMGRGRYRESVLVGLLNDEDSAMSSIVRWMDECVVNAVQSPRVHDPARPDLTVSGIKL